MDTANCQENGILLETIEHLKAALGDQLETLVLERIVIRYFFYWGQNSATVRAGFVYPYKDDSRGRVLPEFRQGPCRTRENFEGQKSSLLATMFSGNVLKRAIGIAVINALSNMLCRTRRPTGLCDFSREGPARWLYAAEKRESCCCGGAGSVYQYAYKH